MNQQIPPPVPAAHTLLPAAVTVTVASPQGPGSTSKSSKTKVHRILQDTRFEHGSSTTKHNSQAVSQTTGPDNDALHLLQETEPSGSEHRGWGRHGKEGVQLQNPRGWICYSEMFDEMALKITLPV